MTKWLGLRYFQDMDAWYKLSPENRKALLILDKMTAPKPPQTKDEGNGAMLADMRAHYEKQGIKVTDEWLASFAESGKAKAKDEQKATQDKSDFAWLIDRG